VTRIPSLGPRGEGWVALQAVVMVLIALADQKGPAIPVTEPSAVAVLDAVGWAAFFTGGALIVISYALLAKARSFTAVPRPRAGGTLVDSGPYRLIRHPLYAGLIVGSLGLALTRLSWITLVLSVALFAILDVKRRREEAWLLERYPEYAAYRARTKALLPFIY
jgi:protein-S-isoprenylcysteine O-methyltransferase Ste14